MDFSKFFACGGLFPIMFGVFTPYKSQKNRLRRCDVSFVHLYKRSVDKQKLRKLERAAGEFLFMLLTGHVPGIRPPLSHTQRRVQDRRKTPSSGSGSEIC